MLAENRALWNFTGNDGGKGLGEKREAYTVVCIVRKGLTGEIYLFGSG